MNDKLSIAIKKCVEDDLPANDIEEMIENWSD